MVIIEYPGFTKTIGELMDDEDYRALQNALVENPERGDLIPGTGGLRKIRWSLAGRGKQGGARIIYYWWTRTSRLYLLLAYPKNVQDNLTPTQAKRLAEAIHRELDDGRKTIR
ncbi:type II toxin-antitoxin system RelE/ParE family toxin [Methylomagnum ishizawai]|uniref:type II toxin-antitoxin system RelE/ParE family toxin n=1 Tax=Methylomagnum ishizawai TaxID=1760988 RepID=UPI001C33AC41|nr:type II toxin-antitoxin system RelE/ParE family toxin [Methylomagnum ishizawai]BBL73028.1 toxin RelE [Methylomagnum ishizawai]